MIVILLLRLWALCHSSSTPSLSECPQQRFAELVRRHRAPIAAFLAHPHVFEISSGILGPLHFEIWYYIHSQTIDITPSQWKRLLGPTAADLPGIVLPGTLCRPYERDDIHTQLLRVIDYCCCNPNERNKYIDAATKLAFPSEM